MMARTAVLVHLTLLLLPTACTTTLTDRVNNAPGRATVTSDPTTEDAGIAPGVALGSEDIISMTDEMMRDMLTCPALSRGTSASAPRVIIDESNFENQSSQIIDKRLITNRLRIGLNRSARGRLSFVARHNRTIEMVEKERALKREGVVDPGVKQNTVATFGADYRLSGSMNTRDQVAPDGTQSRYHQYAFEMVDLETGEIVWSKMYELRKTARDDSIYR